MKRRPGRKFVEKNYKFTFRVLGVFLVLLLIIVGIAMLITRRNTGKTFANSDGISSAEVFPFSYIDSDNTLKVLSSDGKVTSIEKNVSNTIFDSSKNNIYYIKDKALYRYDVNNNSRKILVGNKVTGYKILNDRSAIIYSSSFGDLHLYNPANGEDVVFTEESKYTDIDLLVEIGRSGFIYFDETDKNTNEGILYSRTGNGDTFKIAENVEIGSASISKRDKYISYVSNGTLYITDTEGTALASAKDAVLLTDIEQPYAVSEIKNESKFSEEKEITFAIQNNKIIYFDGESFSTVCEKADRIISYTGTNNRLIYTTKNDDNSCSIYMVLRDRTPEKIATAEEDTSFVWSESLGKLYCLHNKDLKEIDVGEDNQISEIATGVTRVSVYPGKPFVVYSDALKNDYYIISNKQTAKVASGAERLYATSDSNFLLLNTYKAAGSRYIDLDFVKGDSMQKISSDIDSIVAFDNDLNNILYIEKGALQLRNEEGTTTVDTCEAIIPVEIKR